jgi:RNA polymerase sigma-70 factor (ECF subfamily)
LAPQLHELLRRHFREDTAVEVIVERRAGERRSVEERRAGEYADQERAERRRIHSASGRRVGDRRALHVHVRTVELPRRVRPYAERLLFIERLEPSAQQAEDADTARLVARIQGGDRWAFEALYMRYFERVYAYFRIALRDRHAAEELTQQVFVRALDALPGYVRRPGVPFRAWLFTIVRNHAINELARLRRSQPTDPTLLDLQREEAVESVGLPAVDWLSDRELLMFFERLPQAQRQVLMMRYMLGFDYGEIAAITERTEVDVRSLNSRGIRFLRARLSELGRDVPRQPRHAVRARIRWARVASSRRWALHA